MDLKSLETLINTKIEIFCNFEIYVSIKIYKNLGYCHSSTVVPKKLLIY